MILSILIGITCVVVLLFILFGISQGVTRKESGLVYNSSDTKPTASLPLSTKYETLTGITQQNFYTFSSETILTYRPKTMDYLQYKEIRRLQNERIKNRIKRGIMFYISAVLIVLQNGKHDLQTYSPYHRSMQKKQFSQL